MITVSETCIQKLPVRFCRCGGEGEGEGEQLARCGFFPGTEKVVATVFTFGVLDDFLRSNVVAKVSIDDYLKQLRVASNPLDPSSVPVSVSPPRREYWCRLAETLVLRRWRPTLSPAKPTLD